MDSETADEATEEEVKESENTFNVSGKMLESEADAVVCLDRTEYMLDNGDGAEKHEDPAYELAWRSCEDGSKLVTAAGSNEYGSFVSVGRLSKDEKKLVLARRYVEDGDCRSLMSCSDVMSELNINAEKDSMPWRDPILRCSFFKPTSEHKKMFKERKRREKKKRRKS